MAGAMTTQRRSEGRNASHTQTPAPSGFRAGLLNMATVWRDQWRDVFQSRAISADAIAGLTVAAVALPLNVALAVACGLPPIAGLVAGAVGGAIAAIFGGAPFQATGPAAALQVMVLGIARDYGPTGVAAAALICGVIQLALGLAQAGRFARYVPESVLAGFTTGVGIKLLDSQIPEVLGFDYRVFELAQMMHRPAWLHHVSWIAVVCGLSVAFLVVIARPYKRFPAAIVGIGVITFVSAYLHWPIERVGAVASSLPTPSFPMLPDEKWIDLLSLTVPLALLGAVESLLSARAVDRMVPTAKPHEPNLELFGQGLANIGVGLLSGMPVTGVIVRSGVNVQSGARTRLAALLHGVILGGSVLLLGRYIAQVPLAALAGLLCVVGVRLIELKTLAELARSEKIEALAFVVTAAGTVTGHLITGLLAGGALHAVHWYLHRHEEAEKAYLTVQRAKGIRAVLGADGAHARKPDGHDELPASQAWVVNLRQRAQVARTAFVHRAATVIGRVVLGERVHIASGATVRADEGSPFFIGANSNIQDGVVIHALKNRWVKVKGEEWAVYIGRECSVAHDALVHGPCYIGDNTFVGFKAVVHDAVVGAGCYIGIGAVVVGVEVPDGRFVPHGSIVDTADAARRLPPVSHVHTEFNEDVVDVNRGLAAAYHQVEGRPRVSAGRGWDDVASAAPAPWEPAWATARDDGRF